MRTGRYYVSGVVIVDGPTKQVDSWNTSVEVTISRFDQANLTSTVHRVVRFPHSAERWWDAIADALNDVWKKAHALADALSISDSIMDSAQQ